MRFRNYCDKCTVKNRAVCSSLPDDAATGLSRIAHFRRLSAGQIIHSDHQDQTWFAIIVSGVVKLVKSQRDGRQQIVGLQFPADFLGRPFATRSAIVAEATTNLELCCFSKSAFENVMREHPPLEEALLRRALDDLDASREWMFLLGRKTARERVASLLLQIAERIAPPLCETELETEIERHSYEFDLPLSRNEMADTLGLTLETVSREFRHLKSEGVVSTQGRRHVAVLNLPALKTLADGERE
jgi:CRP/FNR family transcriptional regulator